MGIAAVKEFFRQYQLENKVQELPVSSATVELAAQALHCEPSRIAKTLSFIQPDGQIVLIVTAGDTKIDNKKYKQFFACKARMVEASQAEALIGHAVGGICPFAIKPGIKVYLDNSLRRFTSVFPACGSSNSNIELTPQELAKYSQAVSWIDCSKY